MTNGIKTGNPRWFIKGPSTKFRVGSWVWPTPEVGQRTYRPKSCENNNKDEDNSPKILNDKNHQASFLKFWQQTDHLIPARRTDLEIISKEQRICGMVDFTVSVERWVKKVLRETSSWI